MQSSGRYHGLDAVRAIALLLGVALHAAQPYVAGLPWIAPESPSTVLAGIWYTIHMFRMPVFFLIAGFFGRMMLERRGVVEFVKDRSRRILVPLVLGVPVITLITGLAYVLGALASGADLHSLQGLRPPPSPSPVHRSALAGINLIHLWFLYYLLLFYAGALILRSAFGALLGRNERVAAGLDRVLGFMTKNVCGPLILAAPIAAFYAFARFWSPWGGLPAPMSLVPDGGALLAYGMYFGFGWLLHRQAGLLLEMETHWTRYCSLAVVAWIVCRTIAGSRPHWGPFLAGGSLLAYAEFYLVAAWSGSFGLIGAAMRYLSGHSPARRYVADASYWVYLMHIPVLLFLEEFVHPLHWHWSVKYAVCIGAAMPILLLSYHYLVRSTFIGATLNGRRQRRAGAQVLGAAAAG